MKKREKIKKHLELNNENEFLAISGVGMNKMREYGEEFMEVIRDYKKIAKPAKVDTTEETFTLYKEGLEPLEIADKRNMQVTTVYSHLAQLYKAGKEINLEQYLETGELNKVKAVYNDSGKKTQLKPIYQELKEEVSYGAIRLAMAIIEKNS